ncbi:hypothetical protein BGP78_21575 [Pseudoalteromonas sp. MSK9-3]|uniref:hypothetical protein n=1 Tax=Pseudoalteromonas sp. MSK9-3 TaxID=1897633 RepID=UPI000E6CAF5C|nr:hypothetical protein [Pseudoalteromonas sp. MSK9-3]RJE71076.1 hypothetical protein BGP78_21575 [Pseudoalteromonas sp. MSK9-3]
MEKITKPHHQALLNHFKFSPDLMSRFNRKALALLFISYLKTQISLQSILFLTGTTKKTLKPILINKIKP